MSFKGFHCMEYTVFLEEVVVSKLQLQSLTVTVAYTYIGFCSLHHVTTVAMYNLFLSNVEL